METVNPDHEARYLLTSHPAPNPHPEITANPNIMTGMPCIKGTRITVANLLRQIAAGRTPDKICQDYPSLTIESIRAALAFAADIISSETGQCKANER